MQVHNIRTGTSGPARLSYIASKLNLTSSEPYLVWCPDSSQNISARSWTLWRMHIRACSWRSWPLMRHTESTSYEFWRHIESFSRSLWGVLYEDHVRSSTDALKVTCRTMLSTPSDGDSIVVAYEGLDHSFVCAVADIQWPILASVWLYSIGRQVPWKAWVGSEGRRESCRYWVARIFDNGMSHERKTTTF